MLLYKEFHGDLEAIARGEMMAAHEPLTGAGVYVAIDRVTGTLHGNSGSFLIAHRGIRNADGQELSIVIVAGSGTGQLDGDHGHGRHRHRGEEALLRRLVHAARALSGPSPDVSRGGRNRRRPLGVRRPMLDSKPESRVGLRREIATFYVTCLAISWAGMLRWHLPPDFRAGDLATVRAAYDDVGVVMVLGPIAAAILTTLLFRGGGGVLALLRRAVVWRVAPRWYAAALFAPVIPQWLALGAWRAATGAELQPIDLSHAVSLWAQTTCSER